MKTSCERCSKCILSSNFPNIGFDEGGVCSFCRNQRYYVTGHKVIERAKEKIDDLVCRVKGKYDYDALMCYSGGKDSTFALVTSMRKYGLKVLCFTLDNGFMSPTAFENIGRIVEYLGVDQYTFRPSSKIFYPIIRASALNGIYNPKTLTRISAICYSCISLVNITALKLALEKRIPLILAGFTLGQIPSNSIVYKNNYKFLRESREPALNKLRRHVGDSIDEYFCIEDSLLEQTEVSPYNINLLCVENVSEEQIYNEIAALGWVCPNDVDGCSTNCQLNGFSNFVHERTLGYSPYELELSHLIRCGKLTREDGIKKVNDKIDENRLKSIMERLEIGEHDLESLTYIYD